MEENACSHSFLLLIIGDHAMQEDYNSWNYWKVPLPDVDL
jgi:hypothetical protein